MDQQSVRADTSCYFQHISSLVQTDFGARFLPKQSGPTGTGGTELGPQAE
jgi:hypothetical protein